MITLRQVEAFKAVMESGTVLRAAERMGLSQPAVSRLIADLERRLGYRLFSRKKGRVVPLREANALFDEVERAFVGLSNIAEAAQRIGRNSSGILRIATLPFFTWNPFPRTVARFIETHTNIFISLHTRSRDSLLDETASGQHDIAFSTGPINRPDLGVETVAKSEYQLLVPSGHPLAGHDVIPISALDGLEIITSANPAPGLSAMDRALRKARARVDTRIEATMAQMGHALVHEGVGTCMTIRGLVPQFPSDGTRSIPFQPAMPTDIVVAYCANRPPSAIARRFIEAFAEALRPAAEPSARTAPPHQDAAHA